MKHDKLNSSRIIPKRTSYDLKEAACPACGKICENSILLRQHISKMHPQYSSSFSNA